MRALTSQERKILEKVSRSRTEAAEVVSRARSLLAVAKTGNFAEGARASGRKSGYGVAKVVARFNAEGLNALQTKPSHGHRVIYTVSLRAKVLAEYQRTPDRERDGTGTWSLTTLQRAVQKYPELESISRDTISGILHGAGLTFAAWLGVKVSVTNVFLSSSLR